MLNMSKKECERCEKCKKKMGLMSFVCKCQKKFCSSCLQPDIHNCNVDYKALHQETIRKNNPIVVGEKIDKI